MFGLLRPSQELGCGQRRDFNRFYCGLCKGLDHHHGTLTRGLLSYDGVFVALLADALVDEERAAKPDRCRCPLLPVVHRPTVRPDSVAMTFAASVQMLLFDQWAADGETEGKLGRGLVRRLSRPHAELAHGRLDALGVSLRTLEDFEHVQAKVESSREASPVEAAAPTANALRVVFARIAALPGGCPDAETTLGELGAAIGNAIYWIDALEDLADDERGGHFNPCVVEGRRSPSRVRATSRLLRADLDRIPQLLDALPLTRHAPVLRDIVRGELAARGERAIAGTAPPPATALVASIVTRARGFVVAFALLFWAWLCAVPRAWAKAPEAPRSQITGTPFRKLKNESDIVHYDAEVALNNAMGFTSKKTTARTAVTGGGKVVAELSGGTRVQVNASHEQSTLVRFGDPSDPSSSLLGWVDTSAVSAPESAPAPKETPPAPSASAPPPPSASSKKPDATTPGSSKPSFDLGCGNLCDRLCSGCKSPCEELCKPCKSCGDPKSCCDCCTCKDCKQCNECGGCCDSCGKCCK